MTRLTFKEFCDYLLGDISPEDKSLFCFRFKYLMDVCLIHESTVLSTFLTSNGAYINIATNEDSFGENSLFRHTIFFESKAFFEAARMSEMMLVSRKLKISIDVSKHSYEAIKYLICILIYVRMCEARVNGNALLLDDFGDGRIKDKLNESEKEFILKCTEVIP